MRIVTAKLFVGGVFMGFSLASTKFLSNVGQKMTTPGVPAPGVGKGETNGLSINVLRFPVHLKHRRSQERRSGD